ncbi:MAG: hypothetical protein M3P89_13060 [Actinomycetota bacterium]|nr:hypothetical protein [Actinomycetota bacterium]
MNAQAVTVERAVGRPVMSSFHAAFSGGALVGSLTGALAAAVAGARSTCGRSSGRVRGRRGSPSPRSAAMTGGLVVVLGAETAAVVLGYAAMGVGLACMVPLIFVAAAGDDAEPGPALAAVSTPGYLGLLIGPPLIGGLAELAGLSWALILLPVLWRGSPCSPAARHRRG